MAFMASPSKVSSDYIAGLVSEVNIDYMKAMNGRTARTTHHHGNLTEALIEYALNAAQGGTLEGFSLRQASRDLGVSPGAAYRHFPDRDTLLRTVASRGFDALAARFEAALPFASEATSAMEARERFVALGEAYVAFARDHYGLWRLMFGPYGLTWAPPTGRPPAYAWLEKALGEMARWGLIQPVDASAQFFAWSAIHGLSDLQASPAIEAARTQGPVEHQCALIIAALAHPPASE
jgi:AcrR family transcriptional regulator